MFSALKARAEVRYFQRRLAIPVHPLVGPPRDARRGHRYDAETNTIVARRGTVARG